MTVIKEDNGLRVLSLHDLATINYGRSPAEILEDDGIYPVVGTGGSERRGNAYLHEGESIILGRKGSIDRVYFATGKFWTIDTAYYLNNFKEIVPKWLFYVLQSVDFRKMNEATGVPSLSRDLLYKISIPTPLKTEQSKIAEILSTVDRAIEQTETLIAKQQRIKTGLMQDLLSCGIDENGNVRSEQTHQFKDSPLGRIPVEWEVCSLQSLASAEKHAIVDGPFGSNLKTIHYRETGIPIIQSGFVTNGMFSASNYIYIEKSKFNAEIRSKVVAGDIVMAKIGARCGMCAILPDDHPISIIAGNCIKITVSKKNSNKYILACLQQTYSNTSFVELISTTAQPAVNMPSLKMMLLKKPNINEQLMIIECLNNSEAEIRVQEKSLNKLLSLKTALMQDLLTGKKRVTALLKEQEVACV